MTSKIESRLVLGGAAIAQVGRQVHARVEITAEIVAQNVKKGPLARCFSALGWL